MAPTHSSITLTNPLLSGKTQTASFSLGGRTAVTTAATQQSACQSQPVPQVPAQPSDLHGKVAAIQLSALELGGHCGRSNNLKQRWNDSHGGGGGGGDSEGKGLAGPALTSSSTLGPSTALRGVKSSAVSIEMPAQYRGHAAASGNHQTAMGSDRLKSSEFETTGLYLRGVHLCCPSPPTLLPASRPSCPLLN